MKWREADRATITRILGNPAYAGVYRYGLTEADPSSDFRPDGAKRRIRRASASVWIEGHHEPYIALHESAQIRRQLTENRNTAKPYPGRGEALLQGILHCTVHNLPFRTFYPDRTRIRTGPQKRLATYRCDPQLGGSPDAGRCSEVCARAVDPTIEMELLRTLVPPSVDDVREAALAEYRQYETQLRTREDDVRWAKQAVVDLERELEQIGPDQPLYRQRLRQRIEGALHNLEKIQATHQQSPPLPPPLFSDADVQSLKSLLADLPRLWRHPGVSAQQRKVVLRLVIRGIDVTPTSDQWDLRVEWADGTRTQHDLLTHEGVLALIKAKYREGRTFEEIAADLGERGIVQRAGAAAGTLYTPQRIRRLILRLGVQSASDDSAHRHIYARYTGGGVRSSDIADELNGAGLRHLRGRWTIPLVRNVIARFHRGSIPGFPPLQAIRPFGEQVAALHHQGLFPTEIAARLAAEGVVTKIRAPITYNVVLQTLKRRGLRPNSIANEKHLRALLAEWTGTMSTTEMTAEANRLGMRTTRGEPWTIPALRRKLNALDLRALARDRINALFKEWSDKLTLAEMTEKFATLGIRTVNGAAWTYETVRRRLSILRLGYHRLRAVRVDRRRPKSPRRLSGVRNRR